MSLFQRRERQTAQPKNEGEPSLVQDAIEEVNRLQREIYQQLRMKGNVAAISRMMLEDEQCKVLRRLREEYCVLPTISTKTGYWYIYQ